MPMSPEEKTKFLAHFETVKKDSAAPTKLVAKLPAKAHGIKTQKHFNDFLTAIVDDQSAEARDQLKRINATDTALAPFAILRLTAKSVQRRTVACRVLARVADLSALDALIDIAATDEDQGVRNSANDALLKIYNGNPDA